MSDHPTVLGATCRRFRPSRELFAAKLESGEDLDASLALNIDGEMVVDLWGGWHPDRVGRRSRPGPGRPSVCLGRSWPLVGDNRRGSPHHLRLRDEHDGAGLRDHRSDAGRAGERHRDSPSHVIDRISVILPPTRIASQPRTERTSARNPLSSSALLRKAASRVYLFWFFKDSDGPFPREGFRGLAHGDELPGRRPDGCNAAAVRAKALVQVGAGPVGPGLGSRRRSVSSGRRAGRRWQLRHRLCARRQAAQHQHGQGLWQGREGTVV